MAAYEESRPSRLDRVSPRERLVRMADAQGRWPFVCWGQIRLSRFERRLFVRRLFITEDVVSIRWTMSRGHQVLATKDVDACFDKVRATMWFYAEIYWFLPVGQPGAKPLLGFAPFGRRALELPDVLAEAGVYVREGPLRTSMNGRRVSTDGDEVTRGGSDEATVAQPRQVAEQKQFAPSFGIMRQWERGSTAGEERSPCPSRCSGGDQGDDEHEALSVDGARRDDCPTMEDIVEANDGPSLEIDGFEADYVATFAAGLGEDDVRRHADSVVGGGVDDLSYSTVSVDERRIAIDVAPGISDAAKQALISRLEDRAVFSTVVECSR